MPSSAASRKTPGTTSQTFVIDPSQIVTWVSGFQVADRTAVGQTPAHSVLSLAASLFAQLGARGEGAVASMLSTHTLQVGRDTYLFSDNMKVVDLVNVDRENLIAHPADIKLV